MKDGNSVNESQCELKEENVTDFVKRSAAGDVEAFHLLYSHFVQRIFNFVLGLMRVKEDAEDVTQDAFVQAFHNIRALKNPDKFEQWLYKIARNEVYQRFRRRKLEEISLEFDERRELNPVEQDKGSKNPEDVFLEDELGSVVDRALETLPVKLREVFILAVLHQKSYKEISDIVGRSLLSVKTDIYRARVFAKDSIRRYTTRG